MTARRFFQPRAYSALVIVLWIGAVALGLDYVTTKHRQRATEQRICAAEVAAIRARNVWAQQFLCPADPCRCKAIVSR